MRSQPLAGNARATRLPAMLLAGVLATAAGCAHAPPPPPPTMSFTAATPEQLAAVRAAYAARAPGSGVGVVTAARNDLGYVAVGDLPTDGARPGDLIMFVDGANNPITSGSVAAIKDGSLHVRVDPPQPTRRHPQVGDLAVRFR